MKDFFNGKDSISFFEATPSITGDVVEYLYEIIKRNASEEARENGSSPSFGEAKDEFDQMIIDLHDRNAVSDQTSPPMTEMVAYNTCPLGNQAAGNYYVPPLAALMPVTGMNPNVMDKSPGTAHSMMVKVLSFASIVRYEGGFYVFAGSVWRKYSNEQLEELVFSCLEMEIAQSKNGSQIVSSVINLMKMNPRIRAERTDTLKRFFFSNGAYDVETGNLTPVTATDFFTTYINCDYPVTAAECPVFDSFLDTASYGDYAVKEAILQMMGYLLVPYDMAGKAFFVLQGVGNSGKSVLGNLIASFFNEDDVSHVDIFRFKRQFSTSALVGKRVNISMDLPNDRISREAIGVIKMLTGDDAIMVEQKYKDAKSYKPTCKLVFGTNHPIKPADEDEAFLNRLVVIPFRHSVPIEQQNKNLLEQLKQEKPAIAVRALEAYKRLKAQNYEFVRPSGSEIWGGSPKDTVIQSFASQRCVFNDSFYETTEALFAAFRSFCDANRLTGESNKTSFSRQLHEVCGTRIQPQKRRVNGSPPCNGYVGIGLCT